MVAPGLLLEVAGAAAGLALFFRGAPWSPERKKRKPWSCALCAGFHAAWTVVAARAVPEALGACATLAQALPELVAYWGAAFAVAAVVGRVVLPPEVDLSGLVPAPPEEEQPREQVEGPGDPALDGGP